MSPVSIPHCLNQVFCIPWRAKDYTTTARRAHTYLQCLVLYSIRMVNKHIRTPTNGYLPGSLIDSNRLEGIRIVDVDRLEELLRTAEDDQCMAGDVRLPRAPKHISNGYC